MKQPKYTMRLVRRLAVGPELDVPAGATILASAALAARLMLEDHATLADPALLPELLREVDEWDRAAA